MASTWNPLWAQIHVALAVLAERADESLATALKRLMRFCAETQRMRYFPSSLLADIARKFSIEITFNTPPTLSLEGDIVVLEEALLALGRWLAGLGSPLRGQVFIKNEPECTVTVCTVSGDSPLPNPNALQVAESFMVPFPTVQECWTRATGGGKIELRAGTLWLRFEGHKMVSAPDATLRTLLPLVKSGQFELAYHLLSGAEQKRYATIAETWEWFKNGVSSVAESVPLRGVRENDMPLRISWSFPHAMRFFSALGITAIRQTTGADIISFGFEPRATPREFVWRLSMAPPPELPAWYVAGLQRMARDLSATLSWDGSTGEFVVRRPDAIGARLDADIPGWDVFPNDVKVQLREVFESTATFDPAALIPVCDTVLRYILEPIVEQPAFRNAARHISSLNDSSSAKIASEKRKRAQHYLDAIAKGKVKKSFFQTSAVAEWLPLLLDFPNVRSLLGLSAENVEPMKWRNALQDAIQNPMPLLSLVASRLATDSRHNSV